MIKSARQAIAVQTRRAQSGRKGYAKAVRRYIKRVGDLKLESLPVQP